MKIRHFIAIVELRTKIVSLSTFFLALLYTLYTGASISWAPAAGLASGIPGAIPGL